MKRWYVIYTKPGQEGLTEGNSIAQGTAQPLEPSTLEPGDFAQITGALFNSIRSLFGSRTTRQRATVLLTLLGRTIPAHLPRHQLQRAS